jgi:hypothetical protein
MPLRIIDAELSSNAAQSSQFRSANSNVQLTELAASSASDDDDKSSLALATNSAALGNATVDSRRCCQSHSGWCSVATGGVEAKLSATTGSHQFGSRRRTSAL